MCLISKFRSVAAICLLLMEYSDEHALIESVTENSISFLKFLNSVNSMNGVIL